MNAQSALCAQSPALHGSAAPPWSSRGLGVPAGAIGLVLLAQPPDRDACCSELANRLQAHRLATLRLELGAGEAAVGGQARARELPALLRLVGVWVEVMAWARLDRALAGLPIGVFAEGLDAAAALQLVAEGAERHGCGARLAALVTVGGWLELLQGPLGGSVVPTLLLVGADDRHALEVNRRSLQRLACRKRLEVVPGAGPCFDGNGALATTAELAAEWFATHLSAARRG